MPFCNLEMSPSDTSFRSDQATKNVRAALRASFRKVHHQGYQTCLNFMLMFLTRLRDSQNSGIHFCTVILNFIPDPSASGLVPFVHGTSLVGRDGGRGGERLINMALQMVHALEVSGAAGWYCDEEDEGLVLRQYFQQASSLAIFWMKWPFFSLCFLHAKIPSSASKSLAIGRSPQTKIETIFLIQLLRCLHRMYFIQRACL